MRIKGYLQSTFAGMTMLLASLANADLVWSVDNGWSAEGGVLADVLGETIKTSNALEAMNEAKRAQDEGDYRIALSYYKMVINEYPKSIFAPEAYFQMSKVFTARGQFENAYESLQEIIKKYPDYPKFNQIIGEEYEVASIVQSGATPYLWGWFPWFSNINDAIRIYESVVKNAPYSDYAPIALMNISMIAKDEGTPEVAFDALDRLINNYPQSMFVSDAYMQTAKVYDSMVDGPEYDQSPTKGAISFYQDYLILFPTQSDVVVAEEGLNTMRDTYARSRLVMGDFFYYYRNNTIAASIFYNETITLGPSTPAAQEAKEQLAKIESGQLPPMTPYDWFWGRYETPTLDQYLDESHVLNLDNELFDIISVDTFMMTPGAAIVETVDSDGNVNAYQGLAPIYGPGLDNFLFDDGFFQWGPHQIREIR